MFDFPASGAPVVHIPVTYGARPAYGWVGEQESTVTPHFDIPLNLPHAGTVAARIADLLGDGNDGGPAATAAHLEALLRPYRLSGEDPPVAEAARVADEAAALGRRLVAEIVANDAGSDRLGQCVRNLFECLECGEEGATLSLQAGEDPRSLMRPT